MVNRTTSQKGDIMILGMLKKKYRWFKAIMVALLVFSVGASLLLVHAEDEGIEETSDSSEITPTLLRAPSTTEIYLDGVSGDDTNDGSTATNAVKTFEKAKEIATANQTITTIWVTGTVPVSGEISLAGTNAILKRESAFTDYLLETQADTIFHDITVDGNKDNITATGPIYSLIRVANAIATIQDGTVLENNEARHSNIGTGGAVTIEAGTLNMTGGYIHDNQANWGGAIYLGGRANFNMSGGVIENNHAVSDGSKVAAGGGIASWSAYLDGTNTTTISGAAMIRHNRSDEMGGGISLGTNSASNGKDNLVMTGGMIDDNRSGTGGGGIFVQAGFIGKNATATISGGYITNNIMTGTGQGNFAFGGGGIYVNGFNNTVPSFQNGELKLTNALIINNTAEMEGGGYASCPNSQTKIYLKNGVALYANIAESAKEIYILASNAYGAHSGDPTYEISPLMLGGTAYQWKDDDGNDVTINRLSGQLLAINDEYLGLHTDIVQDTNAQTLARVIISGNYSLTRGGGIGSNGTVEMGESDLTSISVRKEWKDIHSSGLPESIDIELYRAIAGELPQYVGYETIVPDSSGNWVITFENLPKNDANGNTFIYTVKERPIEGYIAIVTGDQDNGYIITNSIPRTPPTADHIHIWPPIMILSISLITILIIGFKKFEKE